MTDRPTIGDFRSKSDNKPRETVEPPAPVKTVETPEEAKSEEKLEKEIPLSVAELYQARLKEAGMTLEEARVIYDAILMNGYYEEIITLKKGVRAIFRSRQYDDTLRIQTEFESVQPRLKMTQEDIITRFNLAGSLYEWQGKPIPHGGDDEFDAALAIVKKLPGPVFSLLANELGKFDQKVMVVFGPGATENFI